MPQHENKSCPRCNKTFECKVGNVLECQCSQIQLSYEEKVFIEDKYADCLCINCLHLLKYQYQIIKVQKKLI
jgi:hypothetical protein